MSPYHLPRLVALVAVLAAPAAQASICRVAADGSSSASGASWSTPLSLQAALGNHACQEIWVRRGLYKPVLPANVGNPTIAERRISFEIAPGRRLYGGFAGTEALRDQRDPAVNLSVLSGDIDNNDTTDANGVVTEVDGVRYGNSYHVVTMNGGTTLGPVTRATVLDGVVVTAGYAIGTASDRDNLGGGLLCRATSTGQECSPTLRGVTFSGNRAVHGGAMVALGTTGGISRPLLRRVRFTANRANSNGGALYNDGGLAGQAGPELVDVEFAGNRAGSYGGAMFNNGNQGASRPLLTRVGFSDNSGSYGGAIYNNGTGSGSARAAITNATFSGNTASNDGGAIYNDVGSSGDGRMTLTHVTFSGNAARRGGAIYNNGGSSNQENASPTLSGVIAWGNVATQGGPELHNQHAMPLIRDSIVAGGCPVGSECVGLVTGNPALAALADNGGFSRTLMPNTGSSAINAAASAWCPPTDQREVPRAQGARCDIGAVEVEAPPCYVKHDANGSNNGSSWASAYTRLQTALAHAACGEIRVARGIYIPTDDADTSISFNIRPGQRVYGGFIGTELHLDQRDPAANRTVLSGDLDGDDDTDADGVLVNVTDRNGNNSWRIVLMDGTTSAGNITANTVLDGFAITAAGSDSFGAGLYCNGRGSGSECSPTLRNLLFSANAGDAAGGLFNNGSNGGRASPTLVNVTFRNNRAWMGAGAMENRGWFNGDASPSLINVTFSGNWITAMINDAGNGGRSSPSLNHVTFHGNSDRFSAASMLNLGIGDGISEPVLTNVIMWGGQLTIPEEADCPGSTHAEICNLHAEPVISASLIAGGCPAGGYCGIDVLDADPMLAPLADNGGATPTLLPAADSPAIDAGNDEDCPETDQRGVSRPQGSGCDIGAVETIDSSHDRLFANGFEAG